MARVLDCPGIPSIFLDAAARRTADEFGLSEPTASESLAMQDRKHKEWQLADAILACSEFHKSTLTAAGAPASRIRVIPLWADVDFWQERVTNASRQRHQLRVLYAGAISLRKGVPYLLQAVRTLGDAVILTLVGDISSEITPILARFDGFRHVPYVPKRRLRELYQVNDVFVMPTLGDSFGFVTVEAMAAGLPVIASEHGGAPVPDQSWRVPVGSATAIAERLRYYCDDAAALARDSEVARQYARQFRPERYRIAAGALFRELLSKRPSA
jgi:glycosyltransferase involved in cell wall biosynthesis